MGVKATEGEYKGYPTLLLEWDGPQPDQRPLSLGLGKCKKVLAAHDQIKAFVERHKNDPRRPPMNQESRGNDGGNGSQARTENNAPPRQPAGQRTPSAAERKPTS